MLGEEPLGGHAVDEALRAVAEDLAERCRQILGITRRDAAHGLCHQHAVGVVLVAGGARRQHAVQRIVGRGRRAVAQEVACGIIAPSADLIGGGVRQVLGARAIHPDIHMVQGVFSKS